MFSVRPKYSDVVARNSTPPPPSLLLFWQSCPEIMGKTIDGNARIASLLRGACRWMRDRVHENRVPWIFKSLDATKPAHILCSYAKCFMKYEDTAGISLGVLQKHMENCIRRKRELTQGLESYSSTDTFVFPRGTPEDEDRYSRYVNCRFLTHQALFGFSTERMQILALPRSNSRVLRSVGGQVTQIARLQRNGIYSTSLSILRAHPESHAVLLAYADLLNCIQSMPGYGMTCFAFQHNVPQVFVNGLMCHRDSKPLFVSISRVLLECLKFQFCDCSSTGHQCLITRAEGSDIFHFYHAAFKREDVVDVDILRLSLDLLSQFSTRQATWNKELKFPETCRVLLAKLEQLTSEAGADDSLKGVYASAWAFLGGIVTWIRYDRGALIEFLGDHNAKLQDVIAASMRRHADDAEVQDKGKFLLTALPK